MKLEAIEPCYMEYIPEQLEEGKLYISEEFCTAIHLCACGCKEKTVTPLNKDGWSLNKNDNKEVTLRPSIGNFKWESPYHAHYYITNNRIVWL